MPRHGYLTWKDLLSRLQEMTAEELEQTATVRTVVLDEFFPVAVFRLAGADGDACPAAGILDDGHWFMEIDE